VAPGFCDVMTILAGVKGRFAISLTFVAIIIAVIGGTVLGSCEGEMFPCSKLGFYLNDWIKVKGQPCHGGCDFALLRQLGEFENVDN